MMKKATVVLGCLAATLVTAQLLGNTPSVSVIGSAYAGTHNKTLKHAINMAGVNRMLTQRMSKELLLVAMGYNRRENLRNLRSNHEKFQRVLKGLRFGDVELALEATDNPEVIANLDRVEEIWPIFNVALQEGIASGDVAGDSVGLVSDLSLPLLAAMNDAVKAYENAANTGKLHSMSGLAINLVGRQHMLTQKIAKEFLLVAHGEDVRTNRRRLTQSMQLFESNLNGLMLGDPELRLIPAPSQPIQAQLKSAQRLWQELKPILEVGAAADKVDEDDLADVASLNLALLAELSTVVGMYEAL